MANALRRALDHSDFVTVPLAVIAIAAIPPAPGFLACLAESFLGVLLWSLLEYWVHRALHARNAPVLDHAHRVLRRAHVAHHQHPKAAPGGTLYSTSIILFLIGLAMFAPAIKTVILGFVVGYFLFIVLHHAEHHGWNLSLVDGLAEHHHRHHHARPRGCFGVSTTLWDRIFRTL